MKREWQNCGEGNHLIDQPAPWADPEGRSITICRHLLKVEGPAQTDERCEVCLRWEQRQEKPPRKDLDSRPPQPWRTNA